MSNIRTLWRTDTPNVNEVFELGSEPVAKGGRLYQAVKAEGVSCGQCCASPTCGGEWPICVTDEEVKYLRFEVYSEPTRVMATAGFPCGSLGEEVTTST